METLENMYTKLMDDYDNIQAARRIEKIEAANPYGCNQYGEGWKSPHNGKQSKSGDYIKKNSGEEKKKKSEKTEPNKDTSSEQDDNNKESGKDYKDLRHGIKEVMYKAFSRIARNGYVNGIYFDGENFYTDNQDGRATLLYTADDIDDFLEENNMQESTVDDQTEQFMQSRGREVFEAIDWEEVEENKKHYDKWKH